MGPPTYYTVYLTKKKVYTDNEKRKGSFKIVIYIKLTIIRIEFI